MVSGLCGVFGIVYDLTWKDGVLTNAVLHASRCKAHVVLRYQENEKQVALEKGETVKVMFE